VGAGFLVAALQSVIAAVFISAAAAKAVAPTAFRDTLVLSGVPTRSATPLAILVPLLEAAVALGTILARGRALTTGLDLAALMSLAFVLWQVNVLLRHKRIPCNCFGVTTTQVGWRTLFRAAACFVAAATARGLAGSVGTALPGPSVFLALSVMGAALTLALATTARVAYPALASPQRPHYLSSEE
jgi:hypothetical protein